MPSENRENARRMKELNQKIGCRFCPKNLTLPALRLSAFSCNMLAFECISGNHPG